MYSTSGICWWSYANVFSPYFLFKTLLPSFLQKPGASILPYPSDSQCTASTVNLFTFLCLSVDFVHGEFQYSLTVRCSSFQTSGVEAMFLHHRAKLTAPRPEDGQMPSQHLCAGFHSWFRAGKVTNSKKCPKVPQYYNKGHACVGTAFLPPTWFCWALCCMD